MKFPVSFLCTIRTVSEQVFPWFFTEAHNGNAAMYVTQHTRNARWPGRSPTWLGGIADVEKQSGGFFSIHKKQEDHFVNVTRQYQVTVAFLLKIKLWRGITWECHDIHGVLPTQLLSSWVPSAPLVPWGSWWDAVDPKLMLNVSLLWNLQGIMMDYGV